MTKIMLKHEKKTKLPTENVLAVYQAQPVLTQTRIVTENDFYPYYQISTQKNCTLVETVEKIFLEYLQLMLF